MLISSVFLALLQAQSQERLTTFSLTSTIAIIGLAFTFLSLVVSVTVLITEIRGAVSSTKESLKQMRESNVKEIGDLKIGQERFSKEISEVREVLTQMRISDATSGTAIKELCAQIDANQVKLAQHDIDIMRCRTRVHIIANKIMEMDPKWKLDDKN